MNLKVTHMFRNTAKGWINSHSKDKTMKRHN